MALPKEDKTFAEATVVRAKSSHTYEAYFYESWCIGTVPHGGYVTACFLQVAATHFATTLSKQNQPHSIALHIDFLRRTQAGPALFTVRDTKLGRQTSVIHVTLTQSGREEVLAVITNSNMHTEDGVSFPTTYNLNPAPLPVATNLLSKNTDKNWRLQSNMPLSEFRRATQKTEFYFPREGQASKTCADEWIRLSTGEKWTNASLGYVSDVWPVSLLGQIVSKLLFLRLTNPRFQMPVEASLREENIYDFPEAYNAPVVPDSNGKVTGTMWYPTLLLNLDFKKSLPEEGVEWLFVRTEAKQIKKGRLDIETVILDAEGDLVALSHHVALAVPSERNVAKRVTGASKM
ncbi:thioesterase-like superfamily-domain-containing protein [Amylocarpus encephaloides]|uniref:Thioesterase-like superfamily-domain-containing protein n=1 Tax=Amylocarpus encephaloides TaxID=45428 RepID=A0A9P7YPR2_9HELO|nr:thioesterase-like superfamily-domain-containing protein [Amylocarpus encephaloides]